MWKTKRETKRMGKENEIQKRVNGTGGTKEQVTKAKRGGQKNWTRGNENGDKKTNWGTRTKW